MRASAAAIALAVALAGLAGAGGALATAGHKRHHRHSAHRARPKPEPQPSSPARPMSFDGSCQLSGAVSFTPPMTSAPQPVAQHAYAPGACTGSLIDHAGKSHQLDNAPASYRADSSGDSVSCAFGLASGSGALVFADGELAFAMSEYRAGATPLIHLTGKSGGDAWMPVTPSQGSDPVAAVQACNADGLKEFDLDARLQTNGAISG